MIDAKNQKLGRLASQISKILTGKKKPIYTPFLDSGDNIIVINAEKIKFTGKKYNNKTYYWHTGYPGGIKQRKAREIIEGRFPERIIESSVSRMISRGPLQRDIMVKLHIYQGPTHKHQGQNPQVLDIASMNRKNSKN